LVGEGVGVSMTGIYGMELSFENRERQEKTGRKKYIDSLFFLLYWSNH
jgi:hypothetical protein